jgi:hypothetical protein
MGQISSMILPLNKANAPDGLLRRQPLARQDGAEQ